MIATVFQKISDSICLLSPEAQADLVSVSTLKEVKKGEDLVAIGDFSNELFFIIEGGLRAYYHKEGKDITDWFSFEGDFVCAITSFYTGVPSPHGIEALENTTLLCIQKEAIDRLCDLHHDVERLGRLSTTQTMLQLQQRIVSLQFESAKSRYNSLLSRHKQIEQRAPLSTIASFLGITQETLSRIRGSL